MTTTIPPSTTGNPVPDAPVPSGPAPPAPLVAAEGEEVLDFSVRRRRVLFRLDPDDDPGAELFEAAPALPVGMAVELASLAEALATAGRQGEGAAAGTARRLQGFLAFFDQVLKAGSRERFRARLVDPDRPVDPEQLGKIVQGLMARWGLRPTQPSPASSGPPPGPDAGTPSTAGLPLPASVSTASPSTGS